MSAPTTAGWAKRPRGAGLLVLKVACAEPLTKEELHDRIDERWPDHAFSEDAIRGACRWLVVRGLLRRAGWRPVQGNRPRLLLALTRAGEDVLDQEAMR
jgi:hypothetical protein